MNHILWTERYRPTSLNDIILPKGVRTDLDNMVAAGSLPHLLLSGPPGTGKTTVAQAIVNDLDGEYLVINSSLNGNIDTLRNEIMTYASSVSIFGKRKFVILDEADYLNPNSTQPALRNFMETYARNCGFILTCNFKNRLIEPLWSRCSVIEFKVQTEEKPILAKQFYDRACAILKHENITYNAAVVQELIVRHFPDFRRTINELQRLSASSNIDTGALSAELNSSLKSLIKFMKDKDYTSVRKWVAENSHIDFIDLYRSLYEQASHLFKPGFIPQLVLTLAEYQYKAAFVADQEINTSACLAEIMVRAEWK